MARKKRKSNPLGWIILGLAGLGIFHFGALQDVISHPRTASKPSQSVSAGASASSTAPLSTPRFVNVASLNVRHTPSMSGALITALPRGTALKILDRQDGWLLVDLNPTLEGWVTERLTTTVVPQPSYLPPAQLTGSR